jgi:TerC family integral membrane protein
VNSGIPPFVWLVTIAGFLVIVVLDLLVVSRRRADVASGSAVRWLLGYVALACVFGAGLVASGPPHTGSEFFAGYLTEYSLSVDNLFVFLVVITRMRVPTAAQDKVLFIGIVLSLVMRAAFILAGAAAIAAATWTFYVLGGFLLYTAFALAREGEDVGDTYQEHRVVGTLRRVLPLTEDYIGDRFSVSRDGRRLLTPLVLAIAAIAIANVVFAVDSIPAIFGLTTNAYVVLTANAFALLGLRQLYFVVEALLSRLRYLKVGLVVILGFIGVKLVLEAMWSTHVRHLGHWELPQVSTPGSLAVIVVVLGIVTAASLMVERSVPTESLVGGGTSSERPGRKSCPGREPNSRPFA